jgi:hypothetical protein
MRTLMAYPAHLYRPLFTPFSEIYLAIRYKKRPP